uniref:Uncharacterized protein n=1 Tax=Arundo donax TaxID=35708 RepID=A0A0A8Y9M1_ARUDO
MIVSSIPTALFPLFRMRHCLKIIV